MEKDTQLIKVIITGPESTGKSTLCQKLSTKYKENWLPEYAREYLEKQNGFYEERDLVEIAKGQFAQENEIYQTKNERVFLDTSFEVLKIWSEWKYKSCHPYIQQRFEKQTAQLYLLMYPDLPWVNDPLRENPYDRIEVFDRYVKLLNEYSLPFEVIDGHADTRFSNALKSLEKNIDL